MKEIYLSDQSIPLILGMTIWLNIPMDQKSITVDKTTIIGFNLKSMIMPRYNGNKTSYWEKI